MGIVNRIVPNDDLEEETMKLAMEISKKSHMSRR